MTVYARKTLVTDPRFAGRATIITSLSPGDPIPVVVNRIPVPDLLVICNGCNRNLCKSEVENGEIPFGYLVYLGKRELASDHPYDIYCEECTNTFFPKCNKI